MFDVKISTQKNQLNFNLKVFLNEKSDTSIVIKVIKILGHMLDCKSVL